MMASYQLIQNPEIQKIKIIQSCGEGLQIQAAKSLNNVISTDFSEIGSQNRISQIHHKVKKGASLFKNVNKRYLRQLLDYLINKYSSMSLVFTKDDKDQKLTYELLQFQNSKFDVQGKLVIQLINIFLKLKQSEDQYNYSLKHYRTFTLPLNQQTVEQMNQEDFKIHQLVFDGLFNNKQYAIINTIKEAITELCYGHLIQLKKTTQEKDRQIQNIQLQSTCQFSPIKNGNNQKTQSYNSDINYNHLERIEAGISRMSNGIYVTRF